MDYVKVLEIEEKIKNMESELVVLRKEVEDKKAELRRLHDPCHTCGRSDKQGVIAPPPAVWIYPTVYSIPYYCYACNTWHWNGNVCNKPTPCTVNGTSSTIPNNSNNVNDNVSNDPLNHMWA